MHYKLSDAECATIRPMLPNKVCGVPRVDDRCVLKFDDAGAMRRPQGWRDRCVRRNLLAGLNRSPCSTENGRGFPHRKSGLSTRLAVHEKTDLGQARDRRTPREFQFHE